MHGASRFVKVKAVVEFTLGQEREEFLEVVMQFLFGNIHQAKAFDTGRVDDESAKGQCMHLGKRGGMLPFVAGLADFTNAQVFAWDEVVHQR